MLQRNVGYIYPRKQMRPQCVLTTKGGVDLSILEFLVYYSNHDVFLVLMGL